MSEPTVAAPVEGSTVKKPGRASLVLIILVLVGTYSALFIPVFSGGQASNAQFGYGAMFWSGVGFYFLWKRWGRRGWVGAILGAAIGVVVFAAAAFVSGIIRASAGH